MGNVCMSNFCSDDESNEYLKIVFPYKELLDKSDRRFSSKQSYSSHILPNRKRLSSEETAKKNSSQDDLYVDYGGVSASESARSNSTTTSSHMQSLRRRHRSLSLGSESDTGDSSYGWFEDTDSPMVSYGKEPGDISAGSNQQKPITASDTPLYILETELETQKLWYETAGRRPKQPEEERRYFEKLWEEQLQKSLAVNHGNKNPDSATYNHGRSGRNLKEEVLYKGRGPFSNAVTKAFDKDKNGFELLTLQLPRFKIRRDTDGGSIYCCYLVVIAVNGRSTCFRGKNSFLL